ncbi:MAG: hypothetical protein ABIN58_02635 [candidate division WOR-3 bacterium]
MAVQMYLVQTKEAESDEERATIAGFIAQLGGFVLMATSAGSLIVAFDDQYLTAVKSHHLVDFVGGVSFNPNGPLVGHLQRLFAQNVASQMLEQRGAAPPETSGQAPGAAEKQPDFPPGYRPLRWPKRE